MKPNKNQSIAFEHQFGSILYKTNRFSLVLPRTRN